MSEPLTPGFKKRVTSPNQFIRRAIEQCESLKCPGCPYCLTEDDMQPEDDSLRTTCNKRQKPKDDSSQRTPRRQTSAYEVASPLRANAARKSWRATRRWSMWSIYMNDACVAWGDQNLTRERMKKASDDFRHLLPDEMAALQARAELANHLHPQRLARGPLSPSGECPDLQWLARGPPSPMPSPTLLIRAPVTKSQNTYFRGLYPWKWVPGE